MNAADRAFFLRRAILQALADCGRYAALEASVHEVAAIKAEHLRPTTAELDAQFRAIDAERLADALPTARGRKLMLNDAGRFWLVQNP